MIDPQNYINGYVSMIRNMFLLSSVGLASYGLSNQLKENHFYFKIISIIILLYSIIYGYNATNNLNTYLIEIKDIDNSEYNYIIKQIKGWKNISYVYMFIIFVIISLFIKILMKKKSNNIIYFKI